MACICDGRHNAESHKLHSADCDDYNRRLRWEQVKWDNQDHQCSGSGYAHKAHGKCSGYTFDRT